MFTPKDREFERGWPGRIEGDRVIQLAAQTLQSFFTGGGTAREHAEYPLDEVELRAPVLQPPSVRDFCSANGFCFSNPAAIYGPEEEIPYPEGTRELDYELELAAIVGGEGAVGGFTVMNDWTARDVERAEREAAVCPAKSKDFATSLGPVVVTPDDLPERLELAVRVNGEERSRRTADEPLDWEGLVGFAGRNTRLVAGDVIGLGPLAVGGGTWLQPGDLVELEVGGIGVLRNRII